MATKGSYRPTGLDVLEKERRVRLYMLQLEKTGKISFVPRSDAR